MEPESIKGVGEFVYQTKVGWYDHIELAGLFAIGVFLIGTILKCLIERWLGAKECRDCPDIKTKQEILRNTTLPNIERSMASLDKQLGIINTKLDLIMADKKLVSDEDSDGNPFKGQIK